MTDTQQEIIKKEGKVRHKVYDARLALREAFGEQSNVSIDVVERDPCGLRVTVVVWPSKKHYVHVLPWSRGWSIFVSDREDEGAYDWRNVKKEFAGLQRPLYCPRNRPGPEYVPTSALIAVTVELTQNLIKLSQARFNRARKKHWYWPSTVLTYIQESASHE